MRRIHFSCWLLCCLLLAACTSGSPPATRKASPTPGILPLKDRALSPVSPSTTTLPVPPTETVCPASGTARPMITAPLSPGTHQTILYTLNEGSYDAPTRGQLLFYDIYTGRSTPLVSTANAHIYEAQISVDGQWVLFVTITGSQARQTRLQAIRIDGQGLQTLYCAPDLAIQQLQWSANRQFAAFYDVANEQGLIYLLDTTNGTLRVELTTPPQVGVILRTWLDATRIFLSDTPTDTHLSHLYLLDISKGSHQHLSDLTNLLQQEYGDFDSSYDGLSVFVSSSGCTAEQCIGPSSIVTQSLSDGKQQRILHSQNDAIIAVRVIDQHSVLFIIGNTLSLTGTATDTSHNGLWKINTDGTGMTRLLTTTPQQYSLLNYRTQAFWSNISRDGTLYTLQVSSFPNGDPVDTLVVGSLSGTPPKTFATVSGEAQLAMAGWTTL